MVESSTQATEHRTTRPPLSQESRKEELVQEIDLITMTQAEKHLTILFL